MEMTHSLYSQYDPRGLKAKICHLDYQCGSRSMTIVLPNKDTPIEETESQMSCLKNVEHILNRNNSTKRRLFLVLPKFKIISGFDVSSFCLFVDRFLKIFYFVFID